MNIDIWKKDNLEIVVIDDFFTAKQLKQINKEIIEIEKYSKDISIIGSAVDDNNKLRRTGTARWIEDLYTNSNKDSAIIKGLEKIYHQGGFVKDLIKLNVNYRQLWRCKKKESLVGYYKYGEQYTSHMDSTSFTFIHLFKIGSFEGGELYFADADMTVEFKENRAVLFPGCAYHETKPIHGNGTRVSVATFYAPE
jgi:hypothetical protein